MNVVEATVMRPVVMALACLLAIPCGDSLGRESYGRWEKGGIIEYSMRFVEETKAEFRARAAALAQFDGTIVELDYQYYDPMTAEQELNHQRFLAGRIGEDESDLHIAGFLKDLERVRAKLAEAEGKASPKWETQNPDKKRELDEIKADLFGTDVTAGNLGVILDRSPSMQPYLEKLREKIGQSFPSAHFVEVDGSFLDAPGNNPWYYAHPADWENPFKSGWYCPAIPSVRIHGFVRQCELDTASAIRAMISMHGVDAIYWFCDFDDEVEDWATVEIGKLILEKKVKLYVHTVAQRPPKLLSELIERSGGELVRERVR